MLRLGHVLRWQGCGPHRKCPARLGLEFYEEQCKSCRDDARSEGVSVRHERCVVASGDDGTEEEYEDIGIPDFLKNVKVIR